LYSIARARAQEENQRYGRAVIRRGNLVFELA